MSKGQDMQVPIAGKQDEEAGSSRCSLSAKGIFIRIQQIPGDWATKSLTKHLQKALDTPLSIKYHLTSCQPADHQKKKTAIARLDRLPEKLQALEQTVNYNHSITLEVNGALLMVDKGCLGFTTLYAPEEVSDIEVDFVALHGLSGHAIGSWTGSDVCWLGDYLGKEFPNARILTYGYDAGLSRDTSFSRLSTYAESFIGKLLVLREDVKKSRPLIVLGHSFGGTVLAYALWLLKTSERSEDCDYQALLVALNCMVFFGTPHRGTSVEGLEKLAVSDSKKSLVLDLGRNSEILKILQNVLMQAQGIKMLTCIEQYRPRSPPGEDTKTTIIVEEQEAKLYSSGEEIISIYADHKGMNKFSSPSDDHYGQLLRHFRKVLRASIPQTGLLYHNAAIEAPSDENFMGRTKELQYTSDVFTRQKAQGCPGRAALYGLPGVGKTHLALKYMENHRTQYNTSFSINASTELKLSEHLQLVTFRLTNKYEVSVGLNLQRIDKWLSENPEVQIMIVYDDIDEIFGKIKIEINQFLPKSPQCHLLFTSRHQYFAAKVANGAINTVEILEWDQTDALEFLRQQPVHGSAPEEAMQEIARIVGGLPIALRQTCIFATFLNKSWEDTVLELKQDLSTVLETNPPADRSCSVKRLFETSFERIEKEHPAALAILTLLAFLDPISLGRQVLDDLDNLADTPLLTLRHSHSHRSDAKVHFEIARQRGLQSGLLRNNASTNEYSFHSLTHRFLRARLSGELGVQFIHDAINFVWKNLPVARNAHVLEPWQKASRYLHHAVAVVDHAEKLDAKPVQLVDILVRTAGLLVETGFKDKAIELAVRAFEYSRSIKGCTDEQISTSVSIVGYVYNYGVNNHETAAAALPFYQEAYDLDLVLFGPDDERTIADLHNLGGVQRNTGDWQAAKITFETVIQKGHRLFEHSKDSLHPYAAIGSLGEILREQGQFPEAIKLLREAEAGLRKRQGSESSWTLCCTAELGKTLLDASLSGLIDAHDEAKLKLRTAGKGLSKALGDEDEYTKGAWAALEMATGNGVS